MKRVILFIFCFTVWILLVWPFDPETCTLYIPDIVAGLLASLFVALVMREISRKKIDHWFNPVRLFWAPVYFVVFLYYVIKANIDVAYRVLHPAMPIRPGIVKIKSQLKTHSALTALALSITLTPGTLTVDVTEDGILYVHWINIQTLDEKEAAEKICGRFEWFLKRIFE